MIVDKETALDKWKANYNKTIMRDKADKERNIGLTIEVLEDTTETYPHIEYNRRLQRAKETYNTPLGMRQKLDLTNIEESILNMLMEHEKLIRKRDADNFKFLLPNPADINRINENGTLEYKRGWKSGAQYMINLNKGLR